LNTRRRQGLPGHISRGDTSVSSDSGFVDLFHEADVSRCRRRRRQHFQCREIKDRYLTRDTHIKINFMTWRGWRGHDRGDGDS
jgi:hypothetical protein